ncbi:hypothetical protein AJ79_09511 [Helicocarpus griseus UAMH5409]|uniref:HCNGP-like protein n=1 Tax=Helicocarpus griseus UAMH5409 TaxID=1447875 RepID=A0A2B7WJC4_9EURO|nr:hypothetical protein AJ79_09511 [Helicocarpus griseus UAMH5409]
MLGLAAYGSSSEDECQDSPPLKAQKPKQSIDSPKNNIPQPSGTSIYRYHDNRCNTAFDKPQAETTDPKKPHEITPANTTVGVGDTDRPLVGPFQPSQKSNTTAAPPPSGKSSPFSTNRALLRDMTLPPVPNLDIPPSPTGSPNPAANQKFAHFLSLKKQGVHFNEKLASSSSLRNPSLLSKLMEHAEIDGKAQYATSLSRDLWDPVATLPLWGYKEELLKNQQEIRRGIEEKKAAGQREAIDFVSGGGGGTSGDSSRTGTPSSWAKVRSSAAERVMAGLNREKTGSPITAERGSRTADLERRPRRSDSSHRRRRSRSPTGRRRRSRSR